MNLFERLRDKTGLRMLTKYGDTFRVTSNNQGTFNASTGAFAVSTATQDLYGKMFSLDREFDAPEMTETAANEIFITASGMTFVPKPGMTISETAVSSTYTITKVRRIPESGAAVIYRLLVKQ